MKQSTMNVQELLEMAMVTKMQQNKAKTIGKSKPKTHLHAERVRF